MKHETYLRIIRSHQAEFFHLLPNQGHCRVTAALLLGDTPDVPYHLGLSWYSPSEVRSWDRRLANRIALGRACKPTTAVGIPVELLAFPGLDPMWEHRHINLCRLLHLTVMFLEDTEHELRDNSCYQRDRALWHSLAGLEDPAVVALSVKQFLDADAGLVSRSFPGPVDLGVLASAITNLVPMVPKHMSWVNIYGNMGLLLKLEADGLSDRLRTFSKV